LCRARSVVFPKRLRIVKGERNMPLISGCIRDYRPALYELFWYAWPRPLGPVISQPDRI
jgi:hypothetical protein